MASERPNILYIFPDQWRFDCMEHIGHPAVETPFLTEIAGQGITFTHAYTSCPSCIATRISILTGMTPSNTGRLGYRDGVPWRYANTLVELLRNSGYQTINVGKTHFHPQRAHMGYEINELYDTQKFDAWFTSDYNIWLREKTGGDIVDTATDLGPNSIVAQPWVHPEHLHPNAWTATKAIERLERRDPSRPFFLAMNFHRPHPPYDPPQSFYDRYADRELPPVPVGGWSKKFDKPLTDQVAATGRVPQRMHDRTRRAYFAQMTHIDFQIGRVLRWMLRFGHCIDNTMIVFGSDHGELLGDHHMWRKMNGFEGSAHVPLIVQLPRNMKGVPRNVRADHTVTLEDMMPTFLEEAGLPVPKTVEGRSLSGILRGNEPKEWREFMHGEHCRPNGGWQYLTDGNEKYMYETMTGEEFFFDLRNDPQELHNLAEDTKHTARMAMWRGRLIDILAKRPQDGLVKDGQLQKGIKLPPVRSELMEGATPGLHEH